MAIFRRLLEGVQPGDVALAVHRAQSSQAVRRSPEGDAASGTAGPESATLGVEAKKQLRYLIESVQVVD